ncbi:hypothetical protein LTR37_019271 [Vermiconidia calcicola]|uniref:Uncharacterized protein n=1 Tax=Vermiconidia calcicola TaxID=1690605 RepID=A0ACC3MHL4_9PEZI|nr:hypothetical protein LTR37_019271 [Vermiconidia calcicola]
MARYNYEPLETAEHIRLIEVKDSRYDRCNPLLSSEPHLTIVSFTLDCCPPFETVSYAWGSKVRDRKVFISGSDAVNVTPALEEAVPHLAKLTRTTYLWIVQVCINQDDVAERSIQVAMMGRIYRRAERLLVWMGPETPESSKVMELYSVLKPIKLVESLYVDRESLYLDRRVDTDRERIEEYCGHVFPRLTRYRAGLDEVLRLPWFRRAWVVQEALLAPQFAFIFGSRTLDGRALWRLCQTIQINYRGTLWWEAACKEGVHSMELFRSFVYIMHTRECAGGQIGRGQSLVVLLEALRYEGLVPKYYQASDPRDIIFSAYGCHTMPPSLKPNYRLSAELVFERAARAHIGQTGSLGILAISNGVFSSPCCADSLDRLKLPSWVPDWRVPSIWDPITRDKCVHGIYGEYFCAGRKHPAVPNTAFQTDGQLFLRGKIVSHLVYQSEYRTDGRRTNKLDGLGIVALKEDLSSVSLLSGSLTERRVFQTVTMDNPKHWEDQIFQTYNGDGFVIWDLYRDVSAWHSEESVKCDQYRTSESPDFYTWLEPPHGRWLRNFGSDPELLRTAIDMTRSAALKSARRNPAITNVGALAMVPFTSQVGDVVAILHGAHLPTILRRQSENRYQLVGEAYVEGLCFEDAITWAMDEADDIILI